MVRYCDDLRDGNAVEPQNYWVNTSSNDIVRKFIEKADAAAKDEIERTCRDLDSQIDNLWSILFTTGYLMQRGA